MAVLVLNCGSSSVKCALINEHDGSILLSGQATGLIDETSSSSDASPTAQFSWHHYGGGDLHETETAVEAGAGKVPLSPPYHRQALVVILTVLTERDLMPDIIGHRVVHGGEQLRQSVLIDEAVLEQISACVPLAPLHNPANISGILAAQATWPEIPQVAVFDTAFHSTLPEAAYRYAVPESWYAEHGVRRYGFHGTSHRFVAAQAAQVLGQPLEQLGLVTVHLGNGCSAAAIENGQSIDTTMGMTPLEGLVMGTRSGDIDPGVFAHLHQVAGMTVQDIDRQLNTSGGLLGLSGLSNDMRTLRQAAEDGHGAAQRALAVCRHRLVKHIAGLAVTLSRLDAIVFTGGIGENDVALRAELGQQLRLLGVEIDANANASGETIISQATSLPSLSSGAAPVPAAPVVLVIPTNEEWQIAQESVAVVQAASA